MRILMVQTLSIEGASSERVYPIGIVLLAGLLEDGGHEVEILDMNVHADPFGVLKGRLLDFRPDAACLSLRNIDPLGNKNTSLVPPFVAAARLTASILPEATIITGGTGFSLFPERLMREVPEIRYGFIGEAEHGLPRLLSSLESPPRVAGLCYRLGDTIRLTPPGPDVRHVRLRCPTEGPSRSYPLPCHQCLRACDRHRD